MKELFKILEKILKVLSETQKQNAEILKILRKFDRRYFHIGEEETYDSDGENSRI